MIAELWITNGGISPMVIMICRRGDAASVYSKRERYPK